MTVEFPPELTEPPANPPPWWRESVVFAVTTVLFGASLALLTDRWQKAALLLLAYVSLGAGVVARAWWKHRTKT